MIASGLDIERRPATAADESYLRELFTDSRADLELLPADVRTQLIDMQFVAQRTQQRASHPHASDEILVVDGRPVGRIMLSETHIVDLTVGKAHRRQGIATRVLGQVVARNSPRSTTLQVWSANAAARALYTRVGFELSGDAQGYLTMVHRGER